ncbi:MAG: DUF4118 domain-containing protein [Candidatus Thiothrix putei]|uniref:histidine kinase n=1 Tax=Candidatus Thiothrix putei TaxID=3080811 RepID=A0AA95HKL8_9GAMM|nr:MAG: DUF4118 domain-containing protein [Candidatus Thiothrix putei]
MQSVFKALEKYHYLAALLIMLLALLVSLLLGSWFLPRLGVLLILQLGVGVVAFVGQRASAILAGVFGALAFNYFFTEPRYTLHMHEVEDTVSMLVFMVIALLTSQLAMLYRRQQAELQHTRLRSSILLSVSHDLRTPLASIIGTLSTLQAYRERLPAAELDELINGALEESHRLHHYIENVLQATKIQHGAMNFTTTIQPLMPIVQQVLKRVDNPRVRLDVLPPLPEVKVRESLLAQALYNLVDNALKYSRTAVILKLRFAAPWVEITVTDYGAGIPETLRHKVFESFYSTRSGDSGEGGTGLGLTVAAGIIHAHQGHIDMLPTTAPDAPFGVRIRLPAVPEEQA